MSQLFPLRSAVGACALLALSACSGSSEEAKSDEPQGRTIHMSLSSPANAAERLSDPEELPMPGKIDPEDARWVRKGKGAQYGEPGMPPLIDIACVGGKVQATRHVPSDKGAEAMFAFVGYRGILRLQVSNDGREWTGALDAKDPHWIAITGGPFYATVAGGGKVISPASSMLGELVKSCRASTKEAAETA